MKVEDTFDAAKLLELLSKATRGPWRIDRGMGGSLAGSLYVTAYEREGFNREGDGAICSVSTEKLHFSQDDDTGSRRSSRSWKTPIKKAEADAELIVAAVNALPELLRRLGLDIDATAWLIEFPADKYGPIRYWSAADPMPVISADDATRFARQQDAEDVLRAKGLKDGKATEHMWMAPKKAKAA